MKYKNAAPLNLLQRHQIPIMQGGMGVDISTAELALEIARLGGIGHISDAMSPYLSDKLLRTKYQNSKSKSVLGEISAEGCPDAAWDYDEVYRANYDICSQVMSRKRGDGLIFINIMEKLSMGNPAETLRARLNGALDGGIDGITLSAGLHTGSLKMIEDNPRFRDAAIGTIVSSLRALTIFFRAAERVKRMPDYIVVEGPLAGGHLGFGEDWKNYSLDEIVKEVADYLKKESLEIPVIAAGGIFTGGDALRVMKAGASAVQVATRFTIAKECGLPVHVKHKYINAEVEDVVVNSLSPTGYLMRMLRSSPSMNSNIKPNCKSLGYILDRNGSCSYQKAYADTGCDETGKKLPVTNKMCICHHFMNHSCYTCGSNVVRLKDCVTLDSLGNMQLPTTESIFWDYLEGAETQDGMRI
jgi:nitronate monooxygenase